YKSLELASIPPILFSEVMRDIDLVVSVAHAGGVDPETSHSTVSIVGGSISAGENQSASANIFATIFSL
ncbi:hypothetical protein ACTPD5_22845, partial [Clostridioides difficile]|uniref:hypothetical protein n=1 Tax=Clostridioides difficile TaxID=1496 RepID=UPI003F8D5899